LEEGGESDEWGVAAEGAGWREALAGDGTREADGVLAGVFLVENTTAGGRQP
jgi:hypothetical protein